MAWEGRAAPTPTFVGFTLSDEKGARLIDWSQKLPLGIFPANCSKEPPGKGQEAGKPQRVAMLLGIFLPKLPPKLYPSPKEMKYVFLSPS